MLRARYALAGAPEREREQRAICTSSYILPEAARVRTVPPPQEQQMILGSAACQV